MCTYACYVSQATDLTEQVCLSKMENWKKNPLCSPTLLNSHLILKHGFLVTLFLPQWQQNFTVGSHKGFRCDWWPPTHFADCLEKQNEWKSNWDSVSYEKTKYNEWRDLSKCKASRNDGIMQKSWRKVHKNQEKSK